MKQPMRVIISGGGTGGHIFPAISIANAIKLRYPDVAILFVGAEDRMEMTRVPKAGYDIVGLPVAGFNRKELFKNIAVVKKLITSLFKANSVVKKFNPDIAIGVGGYASGPLLKVASRRGIPTLIQEQNSYAGVTNKLLAKKASKICVAYEGMEAFFPKDKIVLTGNPCRQDLLSDVSKEEAYRFFKLDPMKRTILVLGGSLGARTLNQSIMRNLSLLDNSGVQILWQCGERYQYDLTIEMSDKPQAKDIHLYDFINRMDLAYKAADIVVSRAGAGSISELSILGKPTILVPSPNVAEDHQTKNAMALVDKNAAIMIKDEDATSKLLGSALQIVKDDSMLAMLAKNIKTMAHPNAADHIVDEIEKLVNKEGK
ncbi:undecaprenyldiphospho-muramoylpentapeptide beta-N-acetylglucosaminyltransferase [Dysgonomonas sp. HGC4]|uniref:undecaprenyldiphospho-muramoylpentapeptide beta-N-acetylglucosaminyltransferase n=1 Tax=Dysgonomonas sp. HGC4 TaxID=1658009 RepID=UPI000680B5FD|nr:undecaprenyldiphospho-muramoylpentapeptide beta-N-acetylglucosaminyltransferase [Dysgonomonas sp. HGC4]MBD8349567.1 undecaprenyldiphospho-muramoylpentapeptide beta-N-acetylglucosaminyltransferase [Dysgonomonas sp. HGC4]